MDPYGFYSWYDPSCSKLCLCFDVFVSVFFVFFRISINQLLQNGPHGTTPVVTKTSFQSPAAFRPSSASWDHWDPLTHISLTSDEQLADTKTTSERSETKSYWPWPRPGKLRTMCQILCEKIAGLEREILPLPWKMITGPLPVAPQSEGNQWKRWRHGL